MRSVPTFMIVLIMPQIKLCIIYRPKYGNITYKDDDRNYMLFKWTV